jgi:hypothetical protein
MISKDCMNRILSLRNHFPKLDEKGGILLPLDLKIRDIDFMKYRHLPVNWDTEAVRNDDLPDEFSPDSVKLVDIFRRKTIDLNYEAMLIFDYKTAELVYCFVSDNESGEVNGDVDENVLKSKSIAIIHNHPRDFYSPPSARNFQILALDFEDYELVSSWDSLWILESKENIPNTFVDEIRREIQILYENVTENAYAIYGENEEGFVKASDAYGNLLLNYINNIKLNINLTRRDFDDN